MPIVFLKKRTGKYRAGKLILLVIEPDSYVKNPAYSHIRSEIDKTDRLIS